jgi:hypothetical protein
VMAIQEQDSRPEIDGLFVLTGEVFVEACEEQLLNPLITLGAAQRFGRGQLGTQRIHNQWRKL